METELIKAIPGGGQLIVFVVVVVLFLREMRSAGETNRQIQDQVNQRIDLLTKTFAEQIQAMAVGFQTQVQSLTSELIAVSNRTSQAVSELSSTIRELSSRVKG